MEAMLWMTLPLLTAAGSALLAYFIMQARMEVAIARERELLVEAKTKISCHESEVTTRLKAVEEEAKRKSLDEFLADFRVEERHYMRENKSLFVKKKSMVLQERLFFRTIPLSNWVEHELTLEEGGDVRSLVESASVFTAQSLPERESAGVLMGGSMAGDRITRPARMIG